MTSCEVLSSATSWGLSDVAMTMITAEIINTVDGRNPVPLHRFIRLFTWFYTSQVVQDFFHQQYDSWFVQSNAWISNSDLSFVPFIFMLQTSFLLTLSLGLCLVYVAVPLHLLQFACISLNTYASLVIGTPPSSLTWQWKNNHLKMYLLLKMVIFQCHVSFQGGTSWNHI